MSAYQLTPGGSVASLTLSHPLPPALPPTAIRVRVHAVSLNYRDLMVADGSYPVDLPAPMVPGSDAAGEVIETGSAVTRFAVGDRVMTVFFPNWQDGPASSEKLNMPLGGDGIGVLAEEIVIDQDAAVAIPPQLSYAEAATIPCAAVTAWQALFVEAKLQAGDRVLLLGTGGVSIWALQLAKAAGLFAIVTSSSNAKLARARELGADALINYVETPAWDEEVRRLTGGAGVDLVVEVGGKETLAKSVASVGLGGQVVIIGGASGGFGGQFDPAELLWGIKRLSGIKVGSRAMQEDLVRILSVADIRPVIDRRFAFADAPAAFQYLKGAGHFGKVVIIVKE